MREIIFRGKRLDNGEWVEGSLALWGPEKSRKYSILPIPSDHGVVLSNHTVGSATVGQFTGLLDKNGKRIFEGDVLEVLCRYKKGTPVMVDPIAIGIEPNYKTVWTVEWKTHHTQAGFFTYGVDRRWFRPLTPSRIYNASAVVVGTIHDKEATNGSEAD